MRFFLCLFWALPSPLRKLRDSGQAVRFIFYSAKLHKRISLPSLTQSHISIRRLRKSILKIVPLCVKIIQFEIQLHNFSPFYLLPQKIK